MTTLSGLDHAEVLRELRAAGLGSLPGGGAEVFADRVRAARRARQGAPRHLARTCTAWRTAWACRRTARCSTTTSRPTRSASTTCCACASCRTRPAASWPSSRCRSTRENTVFERRGWSFTTGHDDLKMQAVSRLMLDNIAEHQGVLDHDLDAARPGGAALRRERHPGHGRRGDDRPRRRRGHAHRGEGRLARPRDPRGRPRSRCSATRTTTSCGASTGDAPSPRPRRVHQHLPGRVGAVAPSRPGARPSRSSACRRRSTACSRARRDRRRQLLERRVRARARRATCCCRRCASARTARSSRCSSSRDCRCGRSQTVAVTRESATSVALVQILLPEAEILDRGRARRRPPADRRQGPALGLLGPDAPPRPRRCCGASTPGCRWSSPSGPPAPRCDPERAGRGSTSALRGAVAEAAEHAERGGPGRRRAASASRAGYLARYFEKLRYRFGARERAGLAALLRAGRRVGADPERAGAALRRHRSRTLTPMAVDVAHPHRVGEILERVAARASGWRTTTPSTLLRSRDLVAVGRAADEMRARKHEPGRGHVHRRPEHQLHERLRHGLRLLRLLPPPGRHARGLRPAQARDLQEDRGDARARRHGPADAGRPPPRPRHRLVRGPVPVHQGALPDPPARALAARDPAHLAALEADDPGDALAPARRGPRLAARRRRRDPRRPRAQDHRARRRRRRPSGSASCARRTAWACRRRRR